MSNLAPILPAKKLLHACQMCKYKFASKDELEVHKVTHKFTHPHECTICDVMFTDEGYKEHNDNLATRHPVSCDVLLCPLGSNKFEIEEERDSETVEKHTEDYNLFEGDDDSGDAEEADMYTGQ